MTSKSEGIKFCLSVGADCGQPEFAQAIIEWLNDSRVACVRVLNDSHDNGQLKSIVDFLKRSIGEREISLLITDRIDLVPLLSLDGVHFVNPTGIVQEARRELGCDAIIGAFCGTMRHRGLLAGENGADYVSFGPVAQTGGTNVEIAQPALFEWWNKFTVLPSMAEGGIDCDHAAQIIPHADFLLIDNLSVSPGQYRYGHN